MMRPAASLAVLALLLLASACKEEADSPERMTVEQLQDPESCASCHPTHYRQWKASMHAYAADDPVFIAMNALGQRETDGALGDFCVKCHAPMAVELGLTDGSPESLAELPQHMKGVTCYFCHNVESVDGDNNGQVTLAHDTVMRGGIANAVAPSVHGVQLSRLMSSADPSSSTLCGGCHDIKLENGVHLERTFAEYNDSIFSQPNAAFQTCSSCHMPSTIGLAAQDPTRNVGSRSVHSHLWPGVDVAISDWHDRQAYEEAVECFLNGGIRVYEVGQSSVERIVYEIETTAGHMMPSGASQDRRLWVEMIAYYGEDNELCSNGKVEDGEAVADALDEMFCGDASSVSDVVDEDGRVVFGDRIFDATGAETHMFWRAETIESTALPQATMVDANGFPVRHTVRIEYEVPLNATKVTLRMKMRPIDFDVLEELVEEGTLDPEILDEISTYTIAAASTDLIREGVFKGRPAPLSNNCNEKNFCAFGFEGPLCTDAD